MTTEWQDIWTAPQLAEPVDIWAVVEDKESIKSFEEPHGRRFAYCTRKDVGRQEWDGLLPGWRATHWRPLPEPPKEKP